MLQSCCDGPMTASAQKANNTSQGACQSSWSLGNRGGIALTNHVLGEVLGVTSGG